MYLISDGVNQFGPFQLQQLKAMLFNSQIGMNDMVFNQETKSWSTALEVCSSSDEEPTPTRRSKSGTIGLMPEGGGHVGGGLQKKAPTTTPTKPTSIPVVSGAAKKPANQSLRWYLRNGNLTLGPYHHLHMLVLLKDGLLFPQNQVRRDGETVWRPALEVFTPAMQNQLDDLQGLIIPTPLSPTESTKRKDVRVSLQQPLILIHNSQRSIAMGVDVNRLGVAFCCARPVLEAGEKVMLEISLGERETKTIAGTLERADLLTEASGPPVRKYFLRSDKEIDIEQFRQ